MAQGQWSQCASILYPWQTSLIDLSCPALVALPMEQSSWGRRKVLHLLSLWEESCDSRILIFSLGRVQFALTCTHVHTLTRRHIDEPGLHQKDKHFCCLVSLDLSAELTHVSMMSGLPSEILPLSDSIWKSPNCHHKNLHSLPSPASPQPWDFLMEATHFYWNLRGN